MTDAQDLWARARAAKKNSPESLRAFEVAYDVLPAGAAVADLVSWAQALHHNGRINEARIRYREALQKAPADVEIACALSAILFELGNAQEGLSTLETAFQGATQSDERARVLKAATGAASLCASHELFCARIGRLIATAPAAEQGLLRLSWGEALADARLYSVALTHFAAMAEMDGTSPELAFSWIRAQIDAGRMESAMCAVDEALDRFKGQGNTNPVLVAGLHDLRSWILLLAEPPRHAESFEQNVAAVVLGGAADDRVWRLLASARDESALTVAKRLIPQAQHATSAEAYLAWSTFDGEHSRRIASKLADRASSSGLLALAFAAELAATDQDAAYELVVRGVTSTRDKAGDRRDAHLSQPQLTGSYKRWLRDKPGSMTAGDAASIARCVKVSQPGLALALIEHAVRVDPEHESAYGVAAELRKPRQQEVDALLERLADLPVGGGGTPQGTRHWRWASALSAAGEAATAIDWFRRARRHLGDLPALISEYANAFWQAGQQSEALALLQAALAAHPANTSLLAREADWRTGRAEYVRACDALARLVASQEFSHDQPLKQLAQLISQVDEPDAILNLVKPAAEKQVAPTAWSGWANVLACASRREEAARACECALVGGTVLVAETLNRTLQHFLPDDPVIAHFGALIAKHDSGYATIYWGWVLRQLGLLDQSLAAIQRASDSFRGLVLEREWGRALLDAERPGEALVHLRSARDLAVTANDQTSLFDIDTQIARALVFRDPDESSVAAATVNLREIAMRATGEARFWGLLDWAMMLEQCRRPDEALEKYREIELLDREHPYPTHNKWLLLAQGGDYAQAEELRKDTLSKYESQYAARFSTSAMSRALFQRAEDFAYFAWALLPTLSSPNSDEARTAYERIDRLCSEGLKLQPNSIALLTMQVRLNLDKTIDSAALCDAKKRASRIAMSWAAYRRAGNVLRARIKSWPTATALGDLGQLHLLVGDLPAAKAEFHRSLAIDASKSETHSLLGVAWTRAGKHADAVRSFEAALARQPQNLDAWSNLAETCLKSGQTERARREYEGILRVAPNHIESLIGLSDLDVRDADANKKSNQNAALTAYDQAATRLEHALACCRDSCGSKHLTAKEIADINYSLGYILAMRYEAEGQGNHRLLAEATRYFSQVPETHVSRAKAQSALARINERGRFKSLKSVETLGPLLTVGMALFLLLSAQVTQFVRFQWVPAHYALNANTLDRLAEAKFQGSALKKLHALADGTAADSVLRGRGELDAAVKKALGSKAARKYAEPIAKAARVESGWRAGEPIEPSLYLMLTFGSLIFMIAGLYMRQMLKLKIGPIELEKAALDQITAPSSLGISR